MTQHDDEIRRHLPVEVHWPDSPNWPQEEEIFEVTIDSEGNVLDVDPESLGEYQPVEIRYPDNENWPKEQIIQQDFTGSISGFDFPMPTDSPHTKYIQGEFTEPGKLDYPEADNAFHPMDVHWPGGMTDILATQEHFGSGMIRWPKRAEYLEHYGREDEAFERDE